MFHHDSIAKTIIEVVRVIARPARTHTIACLGFLPKMFISLIEPIPNFHDLTFLSTSDKNVRRLFVSSFFTAIIGPLWSPTIIVIFRARVTPV